LRLLEKVLREIAQDGEKVKCRRKRRSKLQNPSSRETPNSKSQIPTKLQFPKFRIPGPRKGYGLQIFEDLFMGAGKWDET
jgi:hypothetical protein